MMENADLGAMIPQEEEYPQIHGEDESEGDIEQLLKNADDNDLYRQIQKAVQEGHGQQFIEQLGGMVDENGNVFINNQ